MSSVNRRLYKVFLVMSVVLAMMAPALSWASHRMLESGEFGNEATQAASESARILNRDYTPAVLPDNDVSRYGSDADFEHTSPASLVLAWHDAQTLSICPSLYFAPHSMRLAFARAVDEPIDEHGNRLLHIAARSGNLAALWHLLEVGADRNVRNRFHKTPLDVAFRGNAQAAECIRTALSSSDHAIADRLFKRPESTVRTM